MSGITISIRIVSAGVAGTIAWRVGMLALFGPGQAILADPALQSAKFLTVFGGLEPLPRTHGGTLLLWGGLMLVALAHSAAFQIIYRHDDRAFWRRGMEFGVLAWLLMVPWFEFYLPWNVMWEPTSLVILEAACWFGVLQIVAITISATHHALGQPR